MAAESQIRYLEITVGERSVRWRLYNCGEGDQITPAELEDEFALTIEESVKENIRSLISLVRIVTTFYRERRSEPSGVTEIELREELNKLIKVLGRTLYRALFCERLHQKIAEIIQKKPKLLRIELNFSQPDSELATWPWEYLYIPRENRLEVSDFFLALLGELSLNRRMVGRKDLQVRGAPSILLVTSSPPRSPDLPEVEGVTVEAQIKHLFPGAHLDADLKETRRTEENDAPALVTLTAFSHGLQRKPWNIVHIIAHGRLNAKGQGELAFADAAGEADWVDGVRLAGLLRPLISQELKLVFLQACESALPGPFVGISSVAQHLARVGVPAVIGMQAEIEGGAADCFAIAFYNSIAEHQPVDIAVKRGRAELAKGRNKYETGNAFALPVLYLSSYSSLLPEPTEYPRGRGPVPQLTVAPERFSATECPRCGHTSKLGSLICVKCGFELYCRGCAAKGNEMRVELDYTYCPKCEPTRRFVHQSYDVEELRSSVAIS